MRPIVVRLLALAVILAGTLALGVPRAEAATTEKYCCGGYPPGTPTCCGTGGCSNGPNGCEAW